MKVFVLCIFLLLISLIPSAQLPPPVQVSPTLTIRFHPNIELLGFAYFIGFEGTNSDTLMVEIEGKKMLEKDWQNYGYHFYQQYRSLAGSKHLEVALTIAGELWLSHIIPLLLQVPAFPEATIAPGLPASLYLSFSPRRDSLDAYKRATRFLQACNAFYREADFDKYLAASAPWYQAAQRQVSQHLPSTSFIGSMESFYRQSMQQYELIPSLTLPKGMGFGPRYENGGITHVYNVFGAYDFQHFMDTKRPDLGFGNRSKLRELSVHEFGHSFVNPVLNRLPDSLIRKLDTCFNSIKADMEKQGYNTWTSCVIEHFVRAGEIVIARHSGHLQAARRLEKEYIEHRKFIYLPAIIAALETYRQKPAQSYAETVLLALKEWRRRP